MFQLKKDTCDVNCMYGVPVFKLKLILQGIIIELAEQVALNFHCPSCIGGGASIPLFPLYGLQHETIILCTMDCCGQCSYDQTNQWSHKF